MHRIAPNDLVETRYGRARVGMVRSDGKVQVGLSRADARKHGLTFDTVWLPADEVTPVVEPRFALRTLDGQSLASGSAYHVARQLGLDYETAKADAPTLEAWDVGEAHEVFNTHNSPRILERVA